MERFLDTIAATPQIRAIDIKLSQGAKPGLGGILPAAKVTKEIAELRGIPMGFDCLSPPAHSAFHDADSMLDFVERLAEATGLPVGIKSAVGDVSFFRDLARSDGTRERGIDFLTIDGGEGGTGAGPLVFTDHVALPFKIGFSRVYPIFREVGIAERWCSSASGRLGLPENALLAFALGCDAVIGRPRSDAGDRVHPGPALPHRPLPDRGHDELVVADAGPRPGREVGPVRQLHRAPAPGAAPA